MDNMAYGPKKYGTRTPPFVPYGPFLLGVGVVFNLLTIAKNSCETPEKNSSEFV